MGLEAVMKRKSPVPSVQLLGRRETRVSSELPCLHYSLAGELGPLSVAEFLTEKSIHL
jgi:hypothetical protein